jgi:hypothetical protein
MKKKKKKKKEKKREEKDVEKWQAESEGDARVSR